jgi:hypothetical protein
MKRFKHSAGLIALLTLTGCGPQWERDYESQMPAGYRQELVYRERGKSVITSSVLIATRDPREAGKWDMESTGRELPRLGIQSTICPTIAVVVSDSNDSGSEEENFYGIGAMEEPVELIHEERRMIGGIPARIRSVKYKLRPSENDVVEESARLVSEKIQYMIFRLAPYDGERELSRDFSTFVDSFRLLRGEKKRGMGSGRLPVEAGSVEKKSVDRMREDRLVE